MYIVSIIMNILKKKYVSLLSNDDINNGGKVQYESHTLNETKCEKALNKFKVRGVWLYDEI